MNEWHNIISEKDIENFMILYGDFEDSYIVKGQFDSGNYIDDNLTGHEYDNNCLHILFQRQDINPFSIEIMFEQTIRINCFFSRVMGKEAVGADILYAKIVKDDEYYYWTTWKEFDPYNSAHLCNNDIPLIQAKKIRWRIIS